jgi:hypothetical protein
MGVLSTLRQDRREIEYAEKAKAQLGVQLAMNIYCGPEMDKEDEPDDKGKTPKPTNQHRVFDVPLDPKNKTKASLMRSVSRHFGPVLPKSGETLAMRLGHKVSDQYQDNRAGDKMAEVLTPLYAAVLEGHAIRKFEEYMSVNAENRCRSPIDCNSQ